MRADYEQRLRNAERLREELRTKLDKEKETALAELQEKLRVAEADALQLRGQLSTLQQEKGALEEKAAANDVLREKLRVVEADAQRLREQPGTLTLERGALEENVRQLHAVLNSSKL